MTPEAADERSALTIHIRGPHSAGLGGETPAPHPSRRRRKLPQRPRGRGAEILRRGPRREAVAQVGLDDGLDEWDQIRTPRAHQVEHFPRRGRLTRLDPEVRENAEEAAVVAAAARKKEDRNRRARAEEDDEGEAPGVVARVDGRERHVPAHLLPRVARRVEDLREQRDLVRAAEGQYVPIPEVRDRIGQGGRVRANEVLRGAPRP